MSFSHFTTYLCRDVIISTVAGSWWEKKRLSPVSRLRIASISFFQFKIKYIQVLCHSFLMGRFWNNYHIALNQEAQCYLCQTFSIFFSDLSQYRIRKEVIFPLRKGSPGLMLYTVFFHICMGLFLLLKYMGFYLIDHRLYLHKIAQIYQAIRIEV